MIIEMKFVFEDAGEAKGERCLFCRQPIEGIKFQMVYQSGETISGNIVPFNAFICEKCKMEDTKKGAKP